MIPEPTPPIHGVIGIVLAAYPLERRGKVRDIYGIGDHLLIVATDRISAFDVVLPSPVPGKGVVLTEISDLWFRALDDIVPNHQSDVTLMELDLSPHEQLLVGGRSSIVKRAERVDVECVVRGYLAGSGWKEYETNGTLAGETLPVGLAPGDKLEPPRFTPATKNDTGHDENISRNDLALMVGERVAHALEDASLRLFTAASTIAERAGFIIADTKFEFGMIDGQLTLIDEALTPDSSRFWDTVSRQPGREPASFDKQVVRDWLEESGWDKRPPGPVLPDHIIETASDRYRSVRDRLGAAMRFDSDAEG